MRGDECELVTIRSLREGHGVGRAVFDAVRIAASEAGWTRSGGDRQRRLCLRDVPCRADVAVELECASHILLLPRLETEEGGCRTGKKGCAAFVSWLMASHALAPPLQLAVPAARVRLVIATLAVFALGVAGVAVALALPNAESSPPAQFQGDIAAH